MVAFVLYFALTVAAPGMTLLVAAQVARGVAIGWVGAAGIRVFQDLPAPPRAARRPRSPTRARPGHWPPVSWPASP
jgi:hypothetical protein